MKYLKTFENKKIKTGDYVLMKTHYSNFSDELIQRAKEYVNTHIGKIVYLTTGKMANNAIKVQYINVPTEIISYFSKDDNSSNIYYRTFDVDRIFDTAETIEELELKLDSKKYNI